MKRIIVSIAILCIAILSIGQGLDSGEVKRDKIFSTESLFTPIKSGITFGNCRYLQSIPTSFRPIKGDIAGLDKNALVAKCYGFYLALNKPKDIYKDRHTNYSELLVNIKGEMDFDKSSSSILRFNTSGDIEIKNIGGKVYSFGKSISGWCSIDGGEQYCSVVPVYEASLNIGGKNVKIVATSLDSNIDYDPEFDKIVIHEPRKSGDYYRSIKVYSAQIDKPFRFGVDGKKSWYVLRWNKEKKTIRVEKSQLPMGSITAKVDWDVTLNPGDISLSGKAGEKVKVPVGEYKIYALSGHFGNACIAEFDYHLCKEKGASRKSPVIEIKENKVTKLKPLSKFEVWFEYGWFNNELGVVLGFQNRHGAGNMYIESQGQQVKWNYELLDKKTREIVCKGDMHFG